MFGSEGAGDAAADEGVPVKPAIWSCSSIAASIAALLDASAAAASTSQF
jgi:hypothetical protein